MRLRSLFGPRDPDDDPISEIPISESTRQLGLELERARREELGRG